MHRANRPGMLVLLALAGVMAATLAVGLSCEEDYQPTIQHEKFVISPDAVLGVDSATFMIDGKAQTPYRAKNEFGPGVDGVHLYGRDGYSNEMRFSCKDLHEGNYYPGVKLDVPWDSYFGIGEQARWQLAIYANDTRLAWGSYSEPLKPEGAANYQAEVRVDQLVHLKPTDVLRIAVECNGGPYVLGPLHLYGSKPADSVAKMFSPVDQPWPHWLLAQWGTTNYDGPNKATATVIQPCVMTNPGVLPRTVTLKARRRDYLMAPLMGDVEQTFVIAPGQTVTKEFRFKPSDTGRDRLTVLVESPGAAGDPQGQVLRQRPAQRPAHADLPGRQGLAVLLRAGRRSGPGPAGGCGLADDLGALRPADP